MEDEFVYKTVRIPMQILNDKDEPVPNPTFEALVNDLREGVYRPPSGWRVLSFTPTEGSFILFLERRAQPATPYRG